MASAAATRARTRFDAAIGTANAEPISSTTKTIGNVVKVAAVVTPLIYYTVQGVRKKPVDALWTAFFIGLMFAVYIGADNKVHCAPVVTRISAPVPTAT